MEAVRHDLKVYEELPPRRTLLNEQLATIARNPSWYGKPVQIGSYAKVSAANGAKHLLQKRWGKTPADNGWTFSTRTIDEDGEKRSVLFAIFTPDARGRGDKSTTRRPDAEVKVVEVKEDPDEEWEASAHSNGPAAPEAAPEAIPEQPRPALTDEQMERLARIKNLDEILAALTP